MYSPIVLNCQTRTGTLACEDCMAYKQCQAGKTPKKTENAVRLRLSASCPVPA